MDDPWPKPRPLGPPDFNLFDEIWPIGVDFKGGRGAVVIDTESYCYGHCDGLVRVMNEAGVIFGACKHTHRKLWNVLEGVVRRDKS